MEKPNLDQIDQLAGGDELFKKQLLEVLNKEFPIEKQFYFDCVKNDEKIKVAEIVHKLKHKIGILGLDKSYKIAVQYENSLRDGAYDYQEEFEVVLSIISKFLKMLKN